jgi:hypothetical protein
MVLQKLPRFEFCGIVIDSPQFVYDERNSGQIDVYRKKFSATDHSCRIST